VSALRVVVAGAGAGIFSAHRRGLAAIGAEVVGVQDIDPERARRVGADLGCPVHDDVAGLLAEPADVAVITTPHPFHAELAIASLRSGKHVLVEKPIAVQVAEADRMVAEAERCGLVLAVAFQQRTRSEVREARRLIGQGFVGELLRADLLGTWPRRFAYFGTAPWRGSWRGEGGGVLVNQGQHDLDLLCHLAGTPSRVIGWTRTRVHPVETEDTVQAMLGWPGGATGSVHISTAELDEPQRIELTGSRGRLRLLRGRLEVAAMPSDFSEYAASPGDPFAPPLAGDVETIPGGGGGGHEDVYRDLVDALAHGRQPVAPAREAAVALELANAIIYSSKTGREVGLPLDRDAYGALLDGLRSVGRASA
jgi:predicted dehydrogenase